MPTVLLVRHGRTTANTSGVLAGWTPGVHLDETGGEQAAAVGRAAGGVPLAAVVTSPLERCQQTAEATLAGPSGAAAGSVDDGLGECGYGDWTGPPLKKLAKEPLWKVVQQHPSAVVFPGPEGESMARMRRGRSTAVRDWDARLSAEHGADAIWVAVSPRRRDQGDRRRRARACTWTSSSGSSVDPAR